MTNNPTKYESYPASGYRGEAVTRTGLTDGQTDGRTGQKHYNPRNEIIRKSQVFLSYWDDF
jgi:hypothetical protein